MSLKLQASDERTTKRTTKQNRPHSWILAKCQHEF